MEIFIICALFVMLIAVVIVNKTSNYGIGEILCYLNYHKYDENISVVKCTFKDKSNGIAKIVKCSRDNCSCKIGFTVSDYGEQIHDIDFLISKIDGLKRGD